MMASSYGGPEYRCFIGGLAWATDERALEEAFSAFGDILELKIIIDRETGRSRGFGFVTFRDEKSMRDAIERMNGQNLDGRNITVNEAQSQRSGGGGRSRGGGGGGGRRPGGYGGRREGGYDNGGGYGGRGRDGGYGGGGYGGGGYGGRDGGYGGGCREGGYDNGGYGGGRRDGGYGGGGYGGGGRREGGYSDGGSGGGGARYSRGGGAPDRNWRS